MLLKDKIGVVLGVANERSIATHILNSAQQEGAHLFASYLPDESGKMEKRALRATSGLDLMGLYPCQVGSDASIADFFSLVADQAPKIDFLVHSVAYAPLDDLKGPTLQTSREGFAQTMDISVYSFLAATRAASKLLHDGSSVLTLSYYGAEKIVPGYNVMGIAKAALESAVRYSAFELGERGIRCNAISAGPVRTLAASAIGNFSAMGSQYEGIAPLRRCATISEIADSSVYLLSSKSGGCTGEVLHVDGGFHAASGLSS